MKILLLANSTWNIWNFRRSLVQALLSDGHRVTVVAPIDGSVLELERLGCKVLDLRMSVNGLNPVEDFRLIVRMRKLFREEKPDVILSYTIKSNIFGALAARSLGTPFIPNITGLGTAFMSSSLLRFVAENLYRVAFRWLGVVFFQNEEDRDLFLQRRLITPHQARLLPGSGVDLDHFALADYPTDSDALVFLMVARIIRDKGVCEFVSAAREVKAKHSCVRFQLLGEVETSNRTVIDVATLRSWTREGVIEYLGASTDVRPYIARAHCVVLPSYREGAPRTLIEAAAMARPLIATDVPGCRSVVDDGETGLLCKVQNSADLARVMETFLAIPAEKRARMGRAGRSKMAKSFDQAIVIEAYREVLASNILLNQHSS